MLFGPFFFQDALAGLLLAIHIPLLTHEWVNNKALHTYLNNSPKEKSFKQV